MASYGKKAQDKVEETMRERKQGKLRSGSGQKVTSRKQAIAIGLSEARKEGGKVPAKKSSGTGGRKTAAKKSTGARKTAAKKATASRKTTAAKKSTAARKSTTARKSTAAKKSSPRKSTARKSTARKSTARKSAAKKSSR
jgi:hypothetical protein